MIRRITLALLMAAMTSNAFALELNRIFSDDMVLQREKPLVIGGTAGKGEKVTVSFAGQTKVGKAGADGVWSVVLDGVAANRSPQVLTASAGGEKVTIRNVVVGDVILHARQTSIDITLGRDAEGKKAASAYRKNPLLRAITIKTIPSAKPQNDLAAEATRGWSVVDKDSALAMTASAFYLGRDLARNGDVPIGIIDLNMGAAFANFWLSREALMETGKFYNDTEVAKLAEKHEKILEAELKGEKLREKDKTPPKNSMEYPIFPYAGYNGTLCPLAGTGLAAVVVQLGNDYPYMVYQKLLESDNPFDGPALDKAYADTYDIRKVGFRMEDKVVPRVPREWRKCLGDEDLPFGLIVPPGSDLNTLGQHHREMRELQRLVTDETPNVSIILPGSENIDFSGQPADEALLAKRCLGWVEGAVYKKANAPGTGPLFDRMEASFNEATIYFKEGTAKGLKAKGDALNYFEAANVEGDYSPAKAVIDGETIRIESDTVTRIAHVRYNWNQRPNQGLVNGAGLPAVPFRSERAAYHWFVRNDEEDLPEEYFMSANQWKKNDVTLFNAQLEGKGYDNFTGWIGPAGFKTGPFGPNMGVKEIKQGSPADGRLLVGDIIYSANGKILGEKAWEVMAAAVTESETRKRKGKLVLGVRRGSENIDVELTLEVMGTYSSTAPFDCPKTEKIIVNLEDWVVAQGGGLGFLNHDAIFMLATGNPELLGYVRRGVYEMLAREIPTGKIEGSKAGKSWYNSADAFMLGEYYLATGDRNALPHLKYACDKLAASQQPEGGWRHNYPGGDSYGYMPAAGLPAVIGMHLATQAGADIDMESYKLGVYHYQYQRAETGQIIYGKGQIPRPVPRRFEPADMLAGTMHTYNGAVSAAGILMGLIGDHRSAHLCSAISTFSYNTTFEGHGGNFWNNFWTPLGAHQHSKTAYIHFWKNYRWYRECSRMYDGELIGGGRRSAGYGVALVAPRRRIQIVGAPPSPFAVTAPAALKPALEAYWKKDYFGCEKIVNELIAGGTIGVDDLPTVEYLAQAAREMQQSIDIDFARIKTLIDAGDLYEARSFIAGLQGVVPAGDERLDAMQKKLAGAKALRKSKPSKKTGPTTEKPRKWFCLVTDRQFENPPGDERSRQETLVNRAWRRKEPGLEQPLDKANLWKIQVIESMTQAPNGWSEPGFDDSSWMETDLPISWRTFHTALLRTRFNVEDKSRFDGLRLHAWVLRQQGMEIYLNGELIGKVSGVGNSTTISNEFKDSALKHLKNGQNTLAIKTRHNWRWGHRGMHAYNGGFDFNLDARLKD